MLGALDRFLDMRPLRQHRSFRRLWIGTSLQTLGRNITAVAVLYQVWELTQNSFWVGVVGLVQALTMVFFGLIGGTLADAMDRRKLVLGATMGAFIIALALAAQAAWGAGSLTLLLGLLALQTAFFSLGAPSRRTFVPRLLPQDQVPAGVALTHISFQISMLLGPALAGLMIARWGLTACYAIEAATFCAAFYGVAGLPALLPQGASRKAGLAAILDGFGYIKNRPLLTGVFLGDLAATVLAMPIALFPAINAARFGGDPQTLGLFLSMIAVGGVIASILSGWYTRLPYTGQIQLIGALVWGVALLAAGLVSHLGLTLGLLAMAGAADTVAVIARATTLQLATSDAYRGRVSSVEQIVGVAGPELGNFRAGLLAGPFSAGGALALGGASCILAIALIAAGCPAMRKFNAKTSNQPTE